MTVKLATPGSGRTIWQATNALTSLLWLEHIFKKLLESEPCPSRFPKFCESSK